MNNSGFTSDNDIKEARYHLWTKGILEWKCDITQQKIYDFFIQILIKRLLLIVLDD